MAEEKLAAQQREQSAAWAKKEDAVKLRHILKMTVDFDDMELLTAEGRELWRIIKSDLERVVSRLHKNVRETLEPNE